MAPRTVVLAVAAWLAACSHRSTPTIPARVTAITPPATVQGDVEVRFTIADPGSEHADVSVEVRNDGGPWRPARITGPTECLATTPDGVEHAVTWDSLRDAGFRGAATELRLTPVRQGTAGAGMTASMPAADNLALAAARVDTHMLHYGALDPATIALAETHDLVVVHPFGGRLAAADVRRIMDGADANDPADDPIVLAYISIGEDLRTVTVSDAEMLLDPRFVGDGTGPRIDPRGPDADGQPLTGLDPLGMPSNGGTGYASWYLDDNSVDNDPNGIGDGKPDRNRNFGGAFVNAGDPAWFAVCDAMTFDGIDGIPGMRELLRSDTGRGYGCDGLFLDTIDTCAPNFFTDGNSDNQSEFEWTAAGFGDFIRRAKTRYPDKLMLQNRGLFFYDPRKPHYEVNPSESVDFVLFESYRLDSSTAHDYHPYYHPDNRYNAAPKLMAEANRPGGFRVLSLGYAEGPAGSVDKATLRGESTLGMATLLEDIVQAEDLVGFRHYLTDASVTYANRFVLDHRSGPDTTPPAWSSVYNANDPGWPDPANPPTPRAGVQQVVPGSCCATVRWDVALDRHGVSYTLYQSTTPFDFAGDPDLEQATATALVPERGAGYATFGAGVFPYQATVSGLSAGQTYWFCVRARDRAGNEEKNRVALAATPFGQVTITVDGAFGDWAPVPLALTDPDDVPPSAGPDWRQVAVANDGTHLYLRFTSANPFNLDGSPAYGYSRCLIFLDVDHDATTGYAVSSTVGSDLLIAGAELYAQSAGQFNGGWLQSLAAAPQTAVTECEIAVPLARLRAIRADVSQVRLLLVNDEVSDYAPDAGHIDYELKTQ